MARRRTTTNEKIGKWTCGYITTIRILCFLVFFECQQLRIVSADSMFASAAAAVAEASPTKISSVRTTGDASCVSEFGIPCLLGHRPSHLLLTIDQPYHKRIWIALTREPTPHPPPSSFSPGIVDVVSPSIPPTVAAAVAAASSSPPRWQQGNFCDKSKMFEPVFVEADDVGVRETVSFPVFVNNTRSSTEDYYFCLKIGDEWIHQGSIKVRVKSLAILNNNLRAGVISGFRAEGDRTFIEDDGTVSVPADTEVVFRLYGFNFTVGTSIRFTSSKGDRLERCDNFESTKGFLVSSEGLTDRHAIVKAQLPQLGSGDYYYICVKEVKDDGKIVTWTHQGSDKWMRVKPMGRILPLYLQIIFIFFLLSLSGLFSGLNLGLMALDRTELKIIENTGSDSEKRYAKRISPVRKLGNYLLCTLLLGNVLVNSSLTILLDNLTSGLVAIIGSTLAIVLFGEIIPQAICSRHGLAVGAHTVFITKFFMVITFPLSFPISKLLDLILGEEIGNVYNRERLKELIRVTNEYHDLQKDEVNIISGALELSKKTVSDVMTKMDDVFSLHYDAVLDFETMSHIMKQGYSRIPIHDQDKSNIVALLNIKDLAFVDPDDNFPLKTLCQFYNHPINYVFEDTTLASVLDEFKKGQSHMAFVQHVNTETDGDPFYEVVGVVTLEDVIEEILQSEIIDETDVVTDNRRKLRRTVANLKQDFSMFAQQGENQRFQISPQMTLATFQYLSTAVELFKPDNITETVLRRLMKQDVYYQMKMKSKDTPSTPQPFIFQAGKPVDYFVLILEGRVQVTIGKESLVFECGPFTYFGVQALAQLSPQSEVASLPNSASAPSNIPSVSSGTPTRSDSKSAVFVFIPDYTVQAVTDLLYMCIKRTHYQAALRATLMERQHKIDPNDDPFKSFRSESMEKLNGSFRRGTVNSANSSGRSMSSAHAVSNQSLQLISPVPNNFPLGDPGGVSGGNPRRVNEEEQQLARNGANDIGRKFSVHQLQLDSTKNSAAYNNNHENTSIEIPENEGPSLRESRSDVFQSQNGQIPTQPNPNQTML